ncbi:LamG-like jellyroll fold domain-containing protein [Paraflavisolibacter sp. H34]|uniref:rhamnogalacturonan lyase family protein n=1 Tax=Huijunlia imazamoxiresistens TaxID=3127457 RepID=UPI003016EDDE
MEYSKKRPITHGKTHKCARTVRRRLYPLVVTLKFFLLCTGALLSAASAFAQQQLEQLTRGVVAVRTSASQVFVSWRMFKTDPTNIGFNLYRGTTKVNAVPIVAATNYVDNTSSTEAYTVRPVVNGVEGTASPQAPVWSSNILRIPLKKPAGGVTPPYFDFTNGETYEYTANDASVADLDGDGAYEVIVKWDGLGKDNSQGGYTANVLLDAYKLDGTHLWRIDLGRNIRAGAHYTQFVVYDLDGDGKAELAVKTAPNTKDGTGNYLQMGPAATDDDNADYRTSGGWPGFILSGPEYLTIFNGQTGAEMATTLYVPDRTPGNGWGNTREEHNRVDRFLAGVAYLDGKRPSLVMGRGYYGRSAVVAWDWRNGQLTQRWKFDTRDNGLTAFEGQGNHSLSIADVDGDGKDEVVYGSMVVDDNGTGLYSNGLGHGDALHVGDLVPQRPGLEIWKCHEHAGGNGNIGLSLTDAKTGKIIWHVPADYDVGRALTADLDPRYPGNEMWGAAGAGVYSSTGQLISTATPSYNFALWWDGDLQRELLDNGKMDKWSTTANGAGRFFTVYTTGATSNNGTKATPNLTADILGDWREEMIYRNPTSEELMVLTTTLPTPYKLYTLMHDLQYREAIAWQNVGYNQPPHPSFFLGSDMNALLTDADNPDAIIATAADEGGALNKKIQSLSAALADPQFTFAKGMGPEWLKVAADGTLSGTPGDINTGTNLFTIQVLSGNAVRDLVFLRIEVSGTNSPPVWSATTLTGPRALIGYEFTGSVAKNVTDPDSKFIITKVSGPDWLSVSESGALKGTPLPADGGENAFVFQATDDQGASAQATFTIRVVPLGLTHHYKFEENAEDVEGGQHGTVTGSPLYQPAVVEKGFVFDGNDQVNLPEGIANYSKLTIATWVKWNGGADFQRIFDFGNNTAGYMFLTPKAGTNLRFAIRTPEVPEQVLNAPALPVGEWKHIAVTLDGAVARLYVDGVAVAQNGAMALTPASLGNTIQNYIGKSQWPDPLLRGQVDEFRIYNYPLSAEEVLALKNLQPIGSPVLKSAKEVVAIAGIPFQYIPVATNKPTSFAATNLPAGFHIDTATGVISGMPLSAAAFPIHLEVANSAGISYDTIQVSVQSNVVSGVKVLAEDTRNLLEWTPITGFTYGVKRSKSAEGPFIPVATSASATYTDNTITTGTTYYYVITSVYQNQEIATSAVVKAAPEAKRFSYWKFDETSGPVGVDSWGAKNATLLAGVQRMAAKYGNGIRLDGTSASYVTLPAGVMSTLKDFTIATWVNMDAKANWMRLFDFGSGTANYMFLSVQAGSNVVRYAIRSNNSAEQQLSYPYTLPLNTWTHVAITQSGNTSSMYINGELVATNTNMTLNPSVLGNTTQNFIGKAQFAADPLLKGKVDEFKIFNRALSTAEIVNTMKQGQAITFNVLADKAFGDPDFDAGAAASSGLPVTYSSSDESVASVIDGSIHINGVGTATIIAQQGGDEQYAPAISMSQKLVVSQGAQTISFPAISTKYVGDGDFDGGATASSGLAISYSSSNSTVATIVNGRLRIVGAGSATITATQDGDKFYKAATAVAQELIVEKREQVITFDALGEKGYGEADFDAGATASSGLEVVYASSNPAVAAIVNGKVHIVGLGMTEITAAQEGNYRYQAAPARVQPLTVSDKKAPSQPRALTAAKTADGKVLLMWQASTDDIAVTGYDIFLNGKQLNAEPVTSTSFVTEAPAGSLVYGYTVIASDAAKNHSEESAMVLFSNSNGGGAQQTLEILKVFPNPNAGNFKVRLNSKETGTVVISIFNSQGTLVQNTSEGKQNDVYQKEFNLHSVPKGMYLVRVAVGAFVQTSIVMIQ